MSIRVLAAFSLHEQRFGAREIPDRQTDNGDKKHTGDDGKKHTGDDGKKHTGDEGARIEARAAPPRGASVGGGAVECGWRCGGRRNFDHRFVAAMMGS